MCHSKPYRQHNVDELISFYRENLDFFKKLKYPSKEKFLMIEDEVADSGLPAKNHGFFYEFYAILDKI